MSNYWERRKQGLRGQGEYPNPVVKVIQPQDYSDDGKKFNGLNRAQRRG